MDYTFKEHMLAVMSQPFQLQNLSPFDAQDMNVGLTVTLPTGRCRLVPDDVLHSTFAESDFQRRIVGVPLKGPRLRARGGV